MTKFFVTLMLAVQAGHIAKADCIAEYQKRIVEVENDPHGSVVFRVVENATAIGLILPAAVVGMTALGGNSTLTNAEVQSGLRGAALGAGLGLSYQLLVNPHRYSNIQFSEIDKKRGFVGAVAGGSVAGFSAGYLGGSNSPLNTKGKIVTLGTLAVAGAVIGAMSEKRQEDPYEKIEAALKLISLAYSAEPRSQKALEKWTKSNFKENTPYVKTVIKAIRHGNEFGRFCIYKNKIRLMTTSGIAEEVKELLAELK